MNRISPLADRLIGHRICARRRLLGMSCEALAARVGVAFEKLYRIERGHDAIEVSLLVRLAEALEEPIGNFLRDIAGDAYLFADSGAKRLLTAYSEIAAQTDRERLLIFATSLAEPSRLNRTGLQ